MTAKYCGLAILNAIILMQEAGKRKPVPSICCSVAARSTARMQTPGQAASPWPSPANVLAVVSLLLGVSLA